MNKCEFDRKYPIQSSLTGKGIQLLDGSPTKLVSWAKGLSDNGLIVCRLRSTDPMMGIAWVNVIENGHYKAGEVTIVELASGNLWHYNEPDKNGCTCGSKHTSNNKHHYKWCDVRGNK